MEFARSCCAPLLPSAGSVVQPLIPSTELRWPVYILGCGLWVNDKIGSNRLLNPLRL